MSVHLAVALAFAAGLLAWPLLIDHVRNAISTWRWRREEAAWARAYPEESAVARELSEQLDAHDAAGNAERALPDDAPDADIVRCWRAHRATARVLQRVGRAVDDGGPS